MQSLFDILEKCQNSTNQSVVCINWIINQKPEIYAQSWRELYRSEPSMDSIIEDNQEN